MFGEGVDPLHDPAERVHSLAINTWKLSIGDGPRLAVPILTQFERKVEQVGQAPRHREGIHALFKRVLLDDLDHRAVSVVDGDPQMVCSGSVSSISM